MCWGRRTCEEQGAEPAQHVVWAPQGPGRQQVAAHRLLQLSHVLRQEAGGRVHTGSAGIAQAADMLLFSTRASS